MIKRRPLEEHPRVGHAVRHEINQGIFLSLGQQQGPNLAIRKLIGEVATPVIEVHDLAQCRVTAVMEIRASKRNIAQAGGLELRLTRLGDVTTVLGHRSYPGVKEAGVALPPVWLTVALVSSAPQWHWSHRPLPMYT